jgi:hypothetical protein
LAFETGITRAELAWYAKALTVITLGGQRSWKNALLFAMAAVVA